MPAPTNTSLATATDVGTSLPVTITQAADFGGTTYDLWFSYTAQADDTELGVFPYGSAVVYTPSITFWLDVSTQYLFNDAQNRPTQIPITAGTTYYWRVRPNGGNPTPATLTMLVQLGPTQALSTGLIAINDSTSGYPAVIMNATTGAPVAFRHPFSAGEGVCVVQSGQVGALDTAINGMKIYNADFTVRATPTMPATGYTQCLGTNQINTFWAVKSGAESFIVSVDLDGVVGTPISLGAAAGACRTIAPNADNSLVYFARSISNANTAVLVINTSTAVVTTFLAGDANYFLGANLLTLTDDTILVPYERVGFASEIRHYNAAGVLQHTYTLAVDAGLERLFHDPADPAYFWIWTQTSTTYTFTKIKVSDGTTTVVGPQPLFIEGDYQPNASATPTAYFGADFSCVPWILRGVSATTTYPIRRQRRFLLPSSEDNKRVQIPTLELLMRTGIGNTDAPDPQVMLRLSKDGGKTWLPERWMTAGAAGEYLTRVRWTRATGSYRNAVCEVTVSDPADFQFLAMLAPNGVSEGSS